MNFQGEGGWGFYNRNKRLAVVNRLSEQKDCDIINHYHYK